MGITVKAELHYGYNLGDSETDGWQFAEVSDEEYNGTPTMPWWDEDGDGLAGQAEKVLLAAVGFTETDWSADGYFDRQREAKARLGVAFEITGYEGGRTLIVASGTERTAYSSEATEIDPAVLASTTTDAMDRQLADALRILGITPKQDKPAWLLTCYYG